MVASSRRNMATLALVFASGCSPGIVGISGSGSCDGQTCSDHGQCVVAAAGPVCNCDVAFTPNGLTCVDACSVVSCSGHGTCSIQGGEPSCDCEPGYHPQTPNCLVDGDPCAGQTCSGHGTCVATGEAAACTCESSYHRDAHDSLACIADSLCVDADHDTYGTNCAAGDDCDDGNPGLYQLLTGYADTDGDGYGHGVAMRVCSGATLAAGYAPRGGDCDESSTAIPGTQRCPGPRLMSQAEIQEIANDTSDWNTRKSYCDGNLNQMFGSSYVGFGWYDPIIAYSICFNVARYLNLPGATVQTYVDKVLALMRVMSRDQAYGTPVSGQELLAVGDGTTRAFTLRMPAAAGSTVNVYLAPLTAKTFTYSGTITTLCNDYCFDAIVKISDSAGGAAAYTRSVDYHEGYPTKLNWLSSRHPAAGAMFYASVADQAFTAVPAGNVAVSGATLTLTSAPTASQAVFVEYMGPKYEQTGNAMGGVESIKPDSHFPMRSMNVGLAWAYDLIRESEALTPELRAEYSRLLATEVDEYMNTTGVNPYLNDPLSNYFTEGELMGTVATAFAVDEELTTTPEGRVLKDLARTLIGMAQTALDTHIPGGYGFEGTYTNGSATSLLKVFAIWRNATGEDLAPQLQWIANLVRATIHGIKPDRQTFYDGGDWNTLPATPLADVLRSFAHYQSDHPMAPYARQGLADIGMPVPGPTQDYKSGPGAFPLSYVTKGTGALYARSDWGTGAVWMSMSVGPIFSLGHEHLDRGHITLQRGADYLLKDSGDYGAYDTVPWHNTLGFGEGNAPSQCGGNDGGQVTPPKYVEAAEFVYGQEDMKKSYCTGVSRAARTVVYVRPDMVLVHDQAQTTDPAMKKHFNVNFGAAIAQSGNVFSTVVGGSKLFMRSIVPSNPSPTITPAGTSITGANGAFALKGYNYRIITTGQTADSYLHLFQVTSSGQAQMVASAYVTSGDSRAQGAAIATPGTSWVILSSITGAQLTGTLAYPLPLTCPCSHVVGDLVPNTSYQVTIFDAGGAPIQTLTMATNSQGVLAFATPDARAKQVTLTPG
jgi:hypothetical protein